MRRIAITFFLLLAFSSGWTQINRISLTQGRYDFYPDSVGERYMFVCNNDEGLKRVVFLWDSLKNVEFDGKGSTLVFHGFTNPFVLNGCKNVTFRNFNIDWERTFHNEGEILAVEDSHIDLRFGEEYPYRIVHGMLLFTDGKDVIPAGGMLEFDRQKRETAFLVWDYDLGKTGVIPAQELGDRKVRIFRRGVKATVGNTMVIGALNRNVPAFTLSDCENIRFENVNIYHCGGMGVIAQRCKDIEMHRCKVTPSPNKNRVLSITADATHFVNCSGKIVLNECVFENQLDDATNVHGVYVKIIDRKRIEEKDVIDVRLIHPQQFGFDFIKQGIQLEFVDSQSMNTYYTGKVQDVKRLNMEITRVVMESELPETVKIGDAVCDASIAPEVTITNCYIGKNRARGVLLNSRGRTVIEGNTFHTPGAAILLEGDARFWYEQAGVRDLQIRNNVFDNCNYGVWGWACIETRPGIDESCRSKSRYNKNIVIENNLFKIFDNRVLNFYSTDGLIFRNNKIESSLVYPAQNQDKERFITVYCDNVRIDAESSFQK
jgi:hypothetical protein